MVRLEGIMLLLTIVPQAGHTGRDAGSGLKVSERMPKRRGWVIHTTLRGRDIDEWN